MTDTVTYYYLGICVGLTRDNFHSFIDPDAMTAWFAARFPACRPVRVSRLFVPFDPDFDPFGSVQIAEAILPARGEPAPAIPGAFAARFRTPFDPAAITEPPTVHDGFIPLSEVESNEFVRRFPEIASDIIANVEWIVGRRDAEKLEHIFMAFEAALRGDIPVPASSARII